MASLMTAVISRISCRRKAISKLADHRIEKVEDACKIGDMMWVKVTDIDEKGRVNLSHKDAVKEIKAKEAAGERIK